MTAFATTSVPAWAVSGVAGPGPGRPDPAVRAWLIVAVGDGAKAAHAWKSGLAADAATVVIAGATPDEVGRPLAAAIAEARVGVRALVFGPAGDCLVVRAQLFSAGFEDDEVAVAPTGTGPIEVYCAHCQGVTRAEAAIGDVTECVHCGLGLQVYYHVSRLTGRYLGFQADAETLPERYVG